MRWMRLLRPAMLCGLLCGPSLSLHGSSALLLATDAAAPVEMPVVARSGDWRLAGSASSWNENVGLSSASSAPCKVWKRSS